MLEKCHWGHDEQVLHEHEIRKPNKNYGFLFDPAKRTEFLDAVSKLVDEATFQLVAAAVRKIEFAKQYALPANPYDLALEFGLERMFLELNGRGQAGPRLRVRAPSRCVFLSFNKHLLAAGYLFSHSGSDVVRSADFRPLQRQFLPGIRVFSKRLSVSR